MKKIGLIDVDSHNFPNLALMKISSFYKKNGYNVEFASFGKYEKVFQSKIFTFTNDINEYLFETNELIKGGSGYNLNIKLDDNIENIYPDYSLYNIKNIAYGFLTRGCPRNCEFCIVSKKEGRLSYKVSNLSEFWDGQKEIVLLDPNILACNERYDLFDELIKSKAYITFSQGLDIRLIDDLIIEKLKKMKIKMIHFAWDNYDEKIINNFLYFRKNVEYNFRKLRVYILVNFKTDFEYDLYRVYKLKEIGYDPFIMIYDKKNSDNKYLKLARWVNNKFIFNTCEKFEMYNKIEKNNYSLF